MSNQKWVKFGKVVVILTVIVLLITITLSITSDKTTPEEKAIQEAAEAIMKAELHQVKTGDFLKFKNGDIGLITNLGGNDCFYATRIGTQGYEHTFRSLSKNVTEIIKQNTPKWKETAISYCTPPYY